MTSYRVVNPLTGYHWPTPFGDLEAAQTFRANVVHLVQRAPGGDVDLAIEVHDARPTPVETLAADVMTWLRERVAGYHVPTFTRRDAYQRFKGRRDEGYLDAALQLLIERGAIVERSEGVRDHRTRRFVVVVAEEGKRDE